VCELVKKEVIPVLVDEEVDRKKILERMRPEMLEEFV
jgi:hypothetical protein